MGPTRQGAPRGSRVLGAIAAALLGANVVACAGLVGADFDDVHGTTSPISVDGAAPPTDDSGSTPSQPILPEGGACPARLTDCANLCVDLSTDPDNCGACAKTCPGDPHGTPACASGACLLACNGGYTACAAGCCATDQSAADAGKDSAVQDLGIPCAATYCVPGNGDFCCGDSQQFGGDVCENANVSNDSCRDAFFCGSSGDCGGQACCFDQDPQAQDGLQANCQQACPGGGQYLQLCNPAASGECPGGSACTGVFDPNDLQTTYHFCQ
jgi:hypothetical protein